MMNQYDVRTGQTSFDSQEKSKSQKKPQKHNAAMRKKAKE